MVCKKCGAPLTKNVSVCVCCGEPAADHTTGKLVVCVILISLILFLLVWYPGRKAPSTGSVPIPDESVFTAETVQPTPVEKELPNPDSVPLLSELPKETIEEYILRGFSSGLTASDLTELSEADLLLIRSGLFAISGLSFAEGSDLSGFFGSFPWYEANTENPETARQRFNTSQVSSILCIESLLQNK